MYTSTPRANTRIPPDENEGPRILASTLTVTIVAAIIMVSRFYVRLRMVKNIGWDDYMMITAMTMCVAGEIIIVPSVYLGAGRHVQYIDSEDFKRAFQLNFVTQPLYLCAICFVKLSVGFFLLRIAVETYYRRIIIGFMAIMAAWTFGCFFTLVLQCTDLRVLWDHSVKGTCWSGTTLKALSYTNLALNVLTDIAFSVGIPVPMLWNIQLNRRQKASLICVLGLGVFATACVLVKLTYIKNYGLTGDWLWDSRYLTIWTVVECNIAIVAGSLPCLKPLFVTILGSTYGRGTGGLPQQQYPDRLDGSHHSDTQNYASFGSSKATGSGFTVYGPESAAYMLNTIDVNKDSTRDLTNLSGRSSPSPSRASMQSETRLHANTTHGPGRISDITVIKCIDVSESVQTKQMV